MEEGLLQAPEAGQEVEVSVLARSRQRTEDFEN